MNKHSEVISAFLDDQPFDPQALLDALSEARGRELLVDLVVLRKIVQPVEPVIAVLPSPARRRWRTLAAAAALIVAVASGFALGSRAARAPDEVAPAATRVVEAVPFIPEGGLR